MVDQLHEPIRRQALEQLVAKVDELLLIAVGESGCIENRNSHFGRLTADNAKKLERSVCSVRPRASCCGTKNLFQLSPAAILYVSSAAEFSGGQWVSHSQSGIGLFPTGFYATKTKPYSAERC